MTETDAIALAAFIIVVFVFAAIFIGIYLVPWIITTWILFQRAGQAGWKSLIPVYNYIVMAKIAVAPLWMALIVGIVPFVTSFIPTPATDAWLEGTAPTAANMGQLYFEISVYAVSIATLILAIYLAWRFVKQFGRGAWFAIGYSLLPIVTVFMLKKMTYQPSK